MYTYKRNRLSFSTKLIALLRTCKWLVISPLSLPLHWLSFWNRTWSQSSVCKDRAVGANTKGPTIDADMQLYMFEEYRRLKSIFAKVAQLSTSSCSSSSPSEERQVSESRMPREYEIQSVPLIQLSQAQESYEEYHTHNLPRHHKRPRLAHDRPDHGDAFFLLSLGASKKNNLFFFAVNKKTTPTTLHENGMKRPPCYILALHQPETAATRASALSLPIVPSQ